MNTPHSFMSRLLVAFALSLGLALAATAAEKRVALVIGNSTYKTSPLKNPTNDARDMAARLRSLGFDVVERSNLRTRQIGQTLREFRGKLSPDAVALVFYAGHGLQIRGENYLPAVDAEIDSEEDVPNQSLSMRQVMEVLDESKTRLNLVFLDACRNNPYARGFRSTAGEGLARVTAPSGTLISYATRPGSVAADGNGKNGLYTGHLLRQMESASQPVEQVLKRVVSAVKNESQGRQEPWMEGSIEGDFCFGGCGAAPAGQAAAPSRVRTAMEIEDDVWASIRGSGNKAAFEEYLRQYPRGKYAGEAVQLAKAPTSDDSAQIAAWNRAEQSRSTADYEAYLRSFPTGRFAALAASRVNAARLQAESARAVARPALPFAVSEDVWRKLEAAGALQATPPSKNMDVQVDWRQEIDLKAKSITVIKQARRVRQPAPALLEVRSNTSSQFSIVAFIGGETGSVQTTQDVRYMLFGGALQLGRMVPGTEPFFIKEIDSVEGALFPMKTGNTLKVTGKYSNNTPLKFSRRVAEMVAASTLSPRLTGNAWKVVPGEGHVALDQGKLTVVDDYYLEDLGVFLSEIAMRGVAEKPVLMTNPGDHFTWDFRQAGGQVIRNNYYMEKHDVVLAN